MRQAHDIILTAQRLKRADGDFPMVRYVFSLPKR